MMFDGTVQRKGGGRGGGKGKAAGADGGGRHFAAPGEKVDTKTAAYKDKNKARFGNHNRKKGADSKLRKAGAV